MAEEDGIKNEDKWEVLRNAYFILSAFESGLNVYKSEVVASKKEIESLMREYE